MNILAKQRIYVFLKWRSIIRVMPRNSHLLKAEIFSHYTFILNCLMKFNVLSDITAYQLLNSYGCFACK